MTEPRLRRQAEHSRKTDADDRIGALEKARRRRALPDEWHRLERSAAGGFARIVVTLADLMPAWAASFRPVGPPPDAV